MPKISLQESLRAAVEFMNRGRFAEAEGICRRILAVEAGQAETLQLLGVIAMQTGRNEEGIDSLQRAIRSKPGLTEAHRNLGTALVKTGRIPEAIEAYRRAVASRPGDAPSMNYLGMTLRRAGRLEEAGVVFRELIAMHPQLAPAHANYGNVLNAQERVDEAIDAFERAIGLSPGYADAYGYLAVALCKIARLQEGVKAFRKALELAPGNAVTHSNLLFTLHFLPDETMAGIREECERWSSRFVAVKIQEITGLANDASPERRLRIGYVSPDFRAHVLSQIAMPLFAHHDHAKFEIFLYSAVETADGYTDRFRGCANVWRPIVSLGPKDLAMQIRKDEIDILVDLSMHMAETRLMAFGYKPAPVQITWFAYPGTTGLKAIDYRLSDPHIDPPEHDALYTEKTIRLRDSFWCYDSLGDESTPNALPAGTNGQVTFGSLNNFCKVNDVTLELWSRVLQAVPDSRIVILAPVTRRREEVVSKLNVDPARVTFVDRAPRAEYLKYFHAIDISLDTFPYNGHTTSLDSLWMGVPVVTLAGDSCYSRAGLSQLTNLGLPELIARRPEEFVEIARGLAGDRVRLAALRSGLRMRMETSPLMDGERFARAVEAVYRDVWRTWCAGDNSE